MTDDIDLDALQTSGPFPGNPQGKHLTLHDWKPLRFGSGICLTGIVRGHSLLPDGPIQTSALREIACDRSWCKTLNTIYRLGEQAAEKTPPEEKLPLLPLLLRVLLAENWGAAAKIVGDGMMQHLLLLDGEANSDFLKIRLNADTMPLNEGQKLAAAVHARIADGEMPHAVVDAWRALAAETSSPDTCRLTAMAGSAAYDRWYARASEDETARRLRRRLAGWHELADDDRRPLNGAEPDQFKLATALGDEATDGDEEAAEGGLRDKLHRLGPVEVMRPETLAWFAASMPTRQMAVDLVVKVSRKTLITGEGAEVLAAFGRQNGFDAPVSTSRAASMSNGLQTIASKMRNTDVAPIHDGIARAWIVLAADLSLGRTSVGNAAKAIAAAADEHARALPREQAESFRKRSSVLFAAWTVMAAATPPVAGEPKDDAIMAAHFHERHLLKTIGGIDDDGESGREQIADGVIVLAAVGGTSHTSSGKEAVKEFESITGRPVPLAPVPDLAEARAKLAAEFPYALSAIDLLLSDLAGRQHVYFRPTLILGSPGGGKTRLIRKICSALSVPVSRFDGSGSSDNAFGGTPRRWSSGEPCFPLSAIRAAGIANPICHVDEIDKAGSSRHNGSLTQALLPMCEQENSKRFADPYVQSDVNLSFVSFLLTANDDTVLPAPLRDRLRVIRIPHPAIEHLPAIARGIVDEIMSEGFAVPLDGDEIEIAARIWKGGSIRKLRAIVERLLARRDAQAPRH